MRKFIIFSILSLLLLVVSCGRKPGYVMSEGKMVDVLYDIQLAQAIYRNNSPQFTSDSLKDALIAGVLAKHNITQAELDTSLVWYSDNIKYYVVINDSVSSRLRATSNRYNDLKVQADAGTRRENMLLPPFFYLNAKTPTMGFQVDSSKIETLNISDFHIRFDVQGLSKLQDIEAGIFYSYQDTLVSTVIPINENTRYSFPKPELPDSLLKSIYGYVHLKDGIDQLPFNTTLYNISYMDSVSISGNPDSISLGQTERMETITRNPAQQELMAAPIQ